MHEKLGSDREPGRVESVRQKLIRHLLAGTVDASTLKRGVAYISEYLRSRGIKNALIELANQDSNFGGAEGINHFNYNLRYRSGGAEKQSVDKVSLLEFPSSTHLQILSLTTTEMMQSTETTAQLAQILRREAAIATFMGPTRQFWNALPNNGYFSQELGGVQVAFGDTDPPGQRRGAIAISEDGEASILEEQQKLQVRADNFKGYRVVSGTSFYLKSSDHLGAVEFLNDVDRAIVSYFIMYTDQSQQSRLAHLTVSTLVTRVFIKRLLDTHAKEHGWQSYTAAELELVGGGCSILDPDEERFSKISGAVPTHKRDLYLICK